ncbi:MAG: hypothetical protein ACLQUY_26000 [Ktedonobacterales bacterium]
MTTKAAILTGLVLAAGTIAANAYLLSQAAHAARQRHRPRTGYPALSLADRPVLRGAASGSVLYLT